MEFFRFYTSIVRIKQETVEHLSGFLLLQYFALGFLESITVHPVSQVYWHGPRNKTKPVYLNIGNWRVSQTAVMDLIEHNPYKLSMNYCLLLASFPFLSATS